MKILHITTAHRQDDARIYHKECTSLWLHGYDVSLLAPGADRAPTATQPGVVGLGTFSSRIKRMIGSPLRVLRHIWRIRPAVVHIHDPELLLIILPARLLGAKVIYDAHEDAPRHITSKPYIPAVIRPIVAGVFELFENFSTRFCALIVAATPDIAARYDRLGRNTRCVRNFALAAEFMGGEDNRERSLVYIGGLRKDRGIFEMIEIADRLGVTLHLAGPGWPSSLVDELKTLPGWRQVVYHGVLDRIGVGQLLAKASVGLVVLHPRPNYVTSLPVKLFEYLAAGLPVVASDFPYWRNLLAETPAARFAPAENAAEQARVAEQLLDEVEANATALRAEARNLFRRSFSWESEAAVLLEGYAAIDGIAASSRRDHAPGGVV